MQRSKKLKRIIGAIAVVPILSCAHQTVDLGDAHRLPLPEQLVFPVPAVVNATGADTITQISMQNVNFHVDDDVRLGIRNLRGRIRDIKGGNVVSFDDRKSMELTIAYGVIALTPKELSVIMNRYVFGFKGAPIKDLVIRAEGNHIVQTGVMHKLIDIPFEMTADLTVVDGWIKIHPTAMNISGLNGIMLLRAVGRTLQDLLDLSGGKGVKVVGNDILMDPVASLPPPKILGKLTSIVVVDGIVVQTFGTPDAPGRALAPPIEDPNYMYFRGGTIKFGKLYMVNAELATVDADPSDPFDFYMDYYHSMLVAGYHVTLPNFGLITYMPDFDDLGTPKGKVAAPGSH